MSRQLKAGQLLRTRVECYLWSSRNDNSGRILATAKQNDLCLVLEDLIFFDHEMVNVMFNGRMGFVYAMSLDVGKS